jgi:hypothetical protein
MHPKLILPYVLTFCRSICRNEPVWVPLRPLPGKPVKECLSIVPEYVGMYGGTQRNGWAIWEFSKVMIEAEFHCVWESPDGELLDLTPQGFALDKILFLPDGKRKYRGLQIDNIRKPLTRDKDVKRFIELAERKFIELNRSVLPGYYGKIDIPDTVLAIQHEMELLEAKINRRYRR